MKAIFCVVPLLALIQACITLPETGQSALLLTSEAQEIQMGSEGYQEVLKKSKLSKDARLNAILQRVGHKVAVQAQQPQYKWEFALIESKEMNAWCMPGGKVAFYTGILPKLQNEAAMAAVMGHEVAHAVLRHSGQRISQSMIVGLGLGVAQLSMANSQYKDQLLGMLGAGATVGVILPFSRGHESEADTVGLKYMAKAGYDPQEAVRFWQRFKSEGAPPEFLSTHPSGDTRIQELTQKMPSALALYQAAPVKMGLGDKF